MSKRLVHGGYQSRPEIKSRNRKGKPPHFWVPDKSQGEAKPGIAKKKFLFQVLFSAHADKMWDVSVGWRATATRSNGSPDTIIRRLLTIMITADEDDAGTDDDSELQITTVEGRLVVNHVFRTHRSMIWNERKRIFTTRRSVPIRQG